MKAPGMDGGKLNPYASLKLQCPLAFQHLFPSKEIFTDGLHPKLNGLTSYISQNVRIFVSQQKFFKF